MEQQVYDLDVVYYLPDRAKESRQRNTKADFIVASATFLDLRAELLFRQLELVYRDSN